MSYLLNKAKSVLDITGTYKDGEITSLVNAALLDLGIAGIDSEIVSEEDPLIERAVMTYCLAYFRGVENQDSWRDAYNNLKAQLQMATGYTDWGEGCGR